MNILTRYTARVLWLNKKRTAVTILGVILSGALICGVILLAASFQKMMIDREIAYNGNYHAMFTGVPIEKAKYLQQNSAVTASMLSTDKVSAVYGSTNEDKPYLYLSAYDEMAFKYRPVQVVAGRAPQQDDEILVSQAMADDVGQKVEIGSQIGLTRGTRVGPDGEVLDPYLFLDEEETFIAGETRTYTVVGVMEAPFDERFTQSGYTAITFLDEARLAPGDLVNVSVLVRSPRSIYTTASQMADSAGLDISPPAAGQPGGSTIYYNDGLLTWMGIKANASFVQFFLTIITILIVLVVAGSGLVIYNAFSISIGERKKQYGMFASVGATTGQIRRSILFEALIIGLVGIPLGILGGIVGVAITLAYARDIISQVIGISQGMDLVVSPLVIALTVLFSAATILFSAWVPARRAAKVSPVEAIRLNDEIQDTPAQKLKTNPLIRRLFGFEGELALKALKRDRKKNRTTVLSLMISIILFVAFNAMMMYTTTSARMNNEGVNHDVAVFLGDSTDAEAAFIDQASRLPQVQAYSLVRCINGQIRVTREQITERAYRAMVELFAISFSEAGASTSLPATVCAVGQAEFERYLQVLGLDPQIYSDAASLSGVLVNQNSVRNHKLYEFDLLTSKPGDTLTVYGNPQPENDLPGSATFTIGAVTAKLPLGVSPSAQGTLMIVPDAALDSEAIRSNFQGGDYGNMYFKTDDAETLVEKMKPLYKNSVGVALFYYSQAEANRRENMTELMVNLFFYGFLSLITLVGVTNIINTISTNIQLRRREFAMLKSVGLTPAGFSRILCYESLFYGLQALVFGLPIGIALSVLIYYQFGDVSSFGFSLPWGAMLVCVAGVLLIVFATMMLAGRMIRNDHIADTIKEENL